MKCLFLLNKKSCIFLPFLLISSLTSCSSMPDWMGEKEDSPKLEGERVTVFKATQQLVPDSEANNVSVVLSPSEVLKENVNEQHKLAHIALSKKMTIEDKFSLISASEEALSLTVQPVVTEDKIVVLDPHGKVKAFSRSNPKT